MSLPEWATPLPDAPQMRATDRWAIDDLGIPSLDLMERAGEGLARVVAETVPDGPVVVLCGPGNNGGDGFVAARLLHDDGREVTVMAVVEADAYTGDALANLHRLPVALRPFDPAGLDGAAVAIDALLGTGVRGAPRPPADAVVAALNASDAPVVAADVPSGVDASTGEVAGDAVRAVATATFAAGKPGLWVHPGKGFTGRVEVIDIGIPPGAPVDPEAGLADDTLIMRLPRRAAASTKFTSGHVLVAGGSRGMTGAACLAAEAAARAGAGYVTGARPGRAGGHLRDQAHRSDDARPRRRGRCTHPRGRGRRARRRRAARRRARARPWARAGRARRWPSPGRWPPPWMPRC